MIKKLLGIIVLGLLLFSNQSFAKILHFKCTEKYSQYSDTKENYNRNTLILLQIDTDKKLMREWSEFSSIFHPEWKITKITDYNYYSKEPLQTINTDFSTRASFNRWTGSYTSRINKDSALYIYNCESTKQLY